MNPSVAAVSHEGIEASEWVIRWAPELPKRAEVLDVACGRGRHSRHLAALGCRVTAVDREPRASAWLADLPDVNVVISDLEADPWPFTARMFDGIVVTNYLHRPLFAQLLAALGSDGLLIYETFAAGNERFGRPSNPDFLLRRGELLEVARGSLHVIGYEDVLTDRPQPAMVQRLCARRL